MRRSSRPLALGFALALLSTAVGCGSTVQPPPPAPWVQLEEYPDSKTEIVLWIGTDGAFSGHDDTVAVKGALSSTELEQLKGLVSPSLLSVYRQDALPPAQSENLGSAGFPVYRVVVRDEQNMNADNSVLDAFFVEGTLHTETSALVTFAKTSIEAHRASQ